MPSLPRNHVDLLLGKRAAAYKLFSTLAGHPHPRGFQMLKLPDGNHHCGPFFEETAMASTVSELGKSAVQAAGIFARFFANASKADDQAKLTFLEEQHLWFQRFFEREAIASAELDEMRAMIARLPEN